MSLKDLFAAIDARPFRPFKIELLSGRGVPVIHPENVFVLPSREKVLRIEVYDVGFADYSLIYPEGIVALHFNGKSARRK